MLETDATYGVKLLRVGVSTTPLASSTSPPVWGGGKVVFELHVHFIHSRAHATVLAVRAPSVIAPCEMRMTLGG